MANENVSVPIGDVLARLIKDIIEMQSKLDALIISNATILSKLNATTYEEERIKISDKVDQLKKLYSEVLMSDLGGKSSE